jgi:hypothetical protein
MRYSQTYCEGAGDGVVVTGQDGCANVRVSWIARCTGDCGARTDVWQRELHLEDVSTMTVTVRLTGRVGTPRRFRPARPRASTREYARVPVVRAAWGSHGAYDQLVAGPSSTVSIDRLPLTMTSSRPSSVT